MVPVLFTFYIHGVLKLKKNSGAKRLIYEFRTPFERTYTRETPVTKCNFFNSLNGAAVDWYNRHTSRGNEGTYIVEGKHVFRQRSQKWIIQSVQHATKTEV